MYNSGIHPDIISLELDIDKDKVMQIINEEFIKEDRKRNDSKTYTSSLNKVYLESIIDVQSIIAESQIKIWKALKAKPEFDITFDETQKILKRFVDSKVNLIILHIDLVGSTKMSMTLPIDRLTTIIGVFAQQMSSIVSLYGGYVLKYVGDAVLAFFVIEDSDTTNDIQKTKDIGIGYSVSNVELTSLQYSNAISCGCTMIKVIEEGINPILNQSDYPELKVRIGIDFGESSVVKYGLSKEEIDGQRIQRPHIDIFGYTINMAVKMTSIAKPNQIVIGQNLYDNLGEKQKSTFEPLILSRDLWYYTNEVTGSIYQLYGSA